MALHHCEHGHAASHPQVSWTAFHRKDNNMVSFCCAQSVYVTASCQNFGNFCHTVNTCTACLQCGFSCEYLVNQSHWMPSYIHDICMVCLQCGFSCEYSVNQTHWMPSDILDIRMVFLQCALSCAWLDLQRDETPSDTRYICMVFLQCALSCAWLDLQRDETPSDTRYICMVSLHCESPPPKWPILCRVGR